MPKRTASKESEIDLVLATLAETPKEIGRIARGHNEEQLHRAPAAEAWSARDIVAHLRACAEVWGRSIDRMIQEDHPTIRYVSPRGWIKKTDYLDQGFRPSLRAFSDGRVALLDTLRLLDADAWSRRATFTGTTLGRDATVLLYAKRIADHEVHHFDQLRRTLQR
ncbi:MAG: DinB family protein [Candidatus Eisenbacteria bacterium]